MSETIKTGMKTDALIEQLAFQSVPVRRLLPPWQRVLVWLGCAAPYIIFVVFMMGPRAGLAQTFSESRFLIEQISGFLTALAAGFFAFWVVIPGRARWPVLFLALPLAVWLGSMSQGCIQDWRAGQLTFWSDWMCLPVIALVGAGPALVMAVMIRRGAPLYPHLAVGLGGLAAAALGNVGLRFFHPVDASFMVLVWQFGSVALLAIVCGLIGPRLHKWQHV